MSDTTNPVSIGRVTQAIEHAEDAVFSAANAASSYIAESEERDAIVAALVEADNRLRALTRSSKIEHMGTAKLDFGERLESEAGRALLAIEMDAVGRGREADRALRASARQDEREALDVKAKHGVGWRRGH